MSEAASAALSRITKCIIVELLALKETKTNKEKHALGGFMFAFYMI